MPLGPPNGMLAEVDVGLPTSRKCPKACPWVGHFALFYFPLSQYSSIPCPHSKVAVYIRGLTTENKGRMNLELDCLRGRVRTSGTDMNNGGGGGRGRKHQAELGTIYLFTKCWRQEE